MTKYKIIKNSKNYNIIIEGHADASEYGTDIVCASISTAIYMTRNAIELLEPSYNLSNIILDVGYASFCVDLEYKIACKLLEVLEFTLKDLEKQFPKYIKYKK